MVHATSAPSTPVCAANRAGSWKTPAPTIDPTTIAVRAGRLSVAVRDGEGPVSGAGGAVSGRLAVVVMGGLRRSVGVFGRHRS